ncbi:MAG: hypothetical protein DCC67_16070 [Planctomycetota bacterium]|nr:MAG: hypothetical protein DCC67_16070 [Planctomycetota bacterium]
MNKLLAIGMVTAFFPLAARGEAPTAVPAGFVGEVVKDRAGCCDAMPCCGGCGKTARVVCETEKIAKHAWIVECEDYCPLFPSKKWDWNWTIGCPSSQCADAVDALSCAAGPDMPRPGPCRSVRRLVKKEYKVESPAFACVVESRSRDCGAAVAEPSAQTAREPAGKKPLYVADRRESDAAYGE